MNSLPSERAAVIAAIDPIDAQTSARSSVWVSMDKFDRAMALISTGNITGTVNAAVQQATDSSGTDAKALKSSDSFSAGDDNKQAVINVRAGELDVNNGFTHIALVITPAGGTSNVISGLVLGFDPRFGPASDEDASTVKQVVN